MAENGGEYGVKFFKKKEGLGCSKYFEVKRVG